MIKDENTASILKINNRLLALGDTSQWCVITNGVRFSINGQANNFVNLYEFLSTIADDVRFLLDAIDLDANITTETKDTNTQ